MVQYSTVLYSSKVQYSKGIQNRGTKVNVVLWQDLGKAFDTPGKYGHFIIKEEGQAYRSFELPNQLLIIKTSVYTPKQVFAPYGLPFSQNMKENGLLPFYDEQRTKVIFHILSVRRCSRYLVYRSEFRGGSKSDFNLGSVWFGKTDYSYTNVLEDLTY